MRKEKYSVGRGSSADICVSNLKKGDLFEEVSALHFSLIKDVIDDPYSPVFIEVKRNAYINAIKSSILFLVSIFVIRQDSSTNGTFIEKRNCNVKKKEKFSLKLDQLDHKERRYILAHKDMIYIQKNPTIAFKFESLQLTENDLPAEINKMYHVGRQLGSGACGTVYYVQDRRKCTPYALKFTAKNENNMHTLYKEVDLLRILKHPCILSFFNVRTYDSSVAIYLEYMAGGDLFSRIQKIENKGEHMSESLSKFLFYQICTGVKYLHDTRVTHRDLKPENILLSTDEDYALVKISDFGLSKRIQNNSELKTACGTKMYLAPEVRRAKSYTNKVDIWSLGIILYNCLSGRFPFTLENYEKNPGDIHFNCSVWENISIDVISLIQDALKVNADERPSIEELFKRKWLTTNDKYIQMAHKRMAL